MVLTGRLGWAPPPGGCLLLSLSVLGLNSHHVRFLVWDRALVYQETLTNCKHQKHQSEAPDASWWPYVFENRKQDLAAMGWRTEKL